MFGSVPAAMVRRLPKCVRSGAVCPPAGVPEIWYRYVGLDGKVIGIPRFGLSAPGGKVMEKLGMTAASVVDAAKSLA